MDITLRILFRPVEDKLPHIYANVGVDYDERVLPSITTEVLKAVVVCEVPSPLEVCLHTPPAQKSSVLCSRSRAMLSESYIYT